MVLQLLVLGIKQAKQLREVFAQSVIGMSAFEAQVGLAASLGPSTLLQVSPCFKHLQFFRHAQFLPGPYSQPMPDQQTCSSKRGVFMYFFTLNFPSRKPPRACCRGDKCNRAFPYSSYFICSPHYFTTPES